MAWKMTSRDMALSLALAAAGVAAVIFAIAHRWNPQELNPGIEGCLTAGVVGFVMALLHPLPYGSAVALTAPIVAVEYTSSVVAGGPAVGVVGVQLAVMGMIGLAVGLATRRAPEHEEQEDDASAEAHG